MTDSADNSVDSSVEKKSNEEDETLSHSELMIVSSRMLNSLIQKDPLLCDLPSDITLHEVNAQVAVQTGSALTVEVARADGDLVRVVVDRSGAKVSDLRRALQRNVELREKRRTGRRRIISWRYVWRAYCLQTPDGDKLQRRDDSKTLASLGIVNKSRLNFVKRMRDKQRLQE
ncbi:hypothetical protein B566_EDAN006022 [Ephemera danica]|nr:hypothetical protein B566_EDAN006022 [Ephemera danica]